MLNFVRHFATSVGLAAALPCGAVYLDGGGLGQALLYPYYTVQSTDSNAFNTYVSIANTTQAKAVKVRFREGRNSRLVFEFNLYLARGDMWTGAIVPTGAGARLITRDASCTDPPIPTEGVDFSSSSYDGGDDFAGTGLDRTREGHFEVIEMGTLPEVAAGFARISDTGLAVNCAALRAGTTNSQLGPLTGGLTGTGTLINVNGGLDGTYVADALASLAAAPMYSAPGEPGTDFDSPQVSPISHFTIDNVAYRMVWSRGVDAVSSVLVAELFENEFVLDSGTASRTDWVITLPTRRFYVTTSSAQLPFSVPFGPSPYLCEGMSGYAFDREGHSPDGGISFPVPPPSGNRLCWSATAFSIRDEANYAQSGPSDVFGSRNTLGSAFTAPTSMLGFPVPAGFANGRISMQFDNASTMTSQASSTAMDLATGTVTAGSRYLAGYPAIGFIARTFTNGTLACGGSACQGNYASLLTHRRIRGVHLPP